MNIDIRKRLEDIAKGKIPNGFVYLNYSIFPLNWREIAFGDVFEFNGSMSASRNDLSDKGIAYLHYGDIHKSSRTYINFDEEYELLPKLNISEENIKSNALLENGDIVFADASEDYECIGKSVVIYKLNNERFISGLHTIIARSKPGFLDDGFKRFFISEWSIRKQIMRYATGISVYGITKSNLGKVKMCIPNINEQQKIANILSTWDKTIELKEKLIKEKQKQKLGLTQKLLTGKVRLPGFDGEWDDSQLKDYFERVTRKNPDSCKNVLTISAQKGLVNQEDYFNKSVASSNLDNYFLLKNGEFAYNKSYSNGYPMGAIKRLNDYDEGVVTTLYICFYIRNSEKSNGDYFEHYFDSGLLNTALTQIAHEGGRAHGLLNVSPKDFFDLKVIVPPCDEQMAIASVLNTTKKEIDLHEKELEALKLQKKGLMQLLLTGIVRVNVETN